MTLISETEKIKELNSNCVKVQSVRNGIITFIGTHWHKAGGAGNNAGRAANASCINSNIQFRK